MASKEDWRLTNQIDYLFKKQLLFIAYTLYDKDWEHDHCAFCLKLVNAETEKAYCTVDKYHWICATCYEDFKERFGWEVINQSEKMVHHITVGGIATNCWIYPLEDGSYGGQFSPCVLIDPGDEGNRIISFLDSEHLFPAFIALTHGHFDHIGALPVIAEEYNRRQKTGQVQAPPLIAIHAADMCFLGPDSLPFHYRSLGIAAADDSYIRELWMDMPSAGSPPPNIPSADIILSEEDTIGSFTVLHLPGHTQGSIGLWDKDAGILFSGDTLFRGDRGRTDLHGGSEEQIINSLRRLFSMDGEIKVYPGHGPATSIRAEAGRTSMLI